MNGAIFFYGLLFFLVGHEALTAEEAPFYIPIMEKGIKAYQKEHSVPGVAAVLFYEGKPMFFNYGAANRETGQKVNRNTLFEIGSITKSFTAVILASEVLKGKVRLEDPAAHYLQGLKSFQGPFSQVTLGNLATHTSGLPRMVPEIDRKAYAKAIGYLKNWQPEYPIGTRSRYSNFGFGILGLALEGATHKTYNELLSEDILRPLNMDRTFIVVPQQFLDDYAQGYKKNGHPAPRWPLTLIYAAGALRSSSNDMAKFLSACLNIHGTPKEVARSIELTEKGNFKVSLKRTQVLSWMRTDRGSYTIYSKNGGVTGFATFMGYIPEHQTGLVILANKNAGNTSVGQHILREIGDKLSKERNP